MNKYHQPAFGGPASKNKVRLTFAFIFVLTVLAVLIVWPQAPGWFGRFRIHLGLDLQGGTHLVYQADVSQVPDSDRKDRVEALRNVIERRVNIYGVSEPLVQTNYSGDNYRIIVELAGVKDINEAIAIIDRTPQLDFRLQAEPQATSTDAGQIDEIKAKAQAVLQRALAGEDFATLAKEFSQDPGSQENGGDLPWVTKGQFVPEFDQAIFEDLKTDQISTTLVESQFGYHIIKKIEERLNDQGQIEVHAAHILFSKPNADLANTWEASGLSGRHISRAQLNFDQNTQQPLVLIEFNEEGKNLFGQITSANIGQQVAIFLDDGLISSPVVQEAITDGQAQISGNFTVSEAKQLVKDLNLGALPVPIELVSQKTIGATLGDLYVKKSFLAGLIGFLAVALFMLIYYRLPGLLSVLALGIYTAISLAIFISIPVTMTLAGVAGFILSIGMAVDANILIFERTKEELYEGKSLNTAVENGFIRAWSSIRDSNVSSIITCIILAWFGSSIIKVFAITLGLGILVSMFSAITVTRTLLRLMVNKKLENKLSWFGVTGK